MIRYIASIMYVGACFIIVLIANHYAELYGIIMMGNDFRKLGWFRMGFESVYFWPARVFLSGGDGLEMSEIVSMIFWIVLLTGPMIMYQVIFNIPWKRRVDSQKPD